MSVEVRPMQEEDRDRIVALHLQAFNLPAGDLDRLYAIPLEDVRVVTEGGPPVASLRLLRVGHFCGGRSVAAADVTAVQVAPESRSKGYGGLLMREFLQELREEGMPFSTLDPSTPAPYRRAGYEMAGVYTRYSVPVAALPRHRYHDVEPWDDSALDEIVDCYRSRATGFEGLVDRPRSWWPERILRVAPPENRPVYRYLVRRQGKVTGYIVFTQERTDHPIPYFHSLGCRDLVWQDADTARSLLGFAASHRALATDLTWTGPVEDPLTLFLDEQDASAQWSMLWMARLIHVKNALEARGYPPGLEAAIEFTVEDAVVPANSGAYRLEVADGQGRVESIEQARMKVDVGGLAAMYTSWLPARDAVRGGRLTDAGKQEVETLEAIFAGAKPWLADQF